MVFDEKPIAPTTQSNAAAPAEQLPAKLHGNHVVEGLVEPASSKADAPGGNAEPLAVSEPEALARVPSGPAYTVFSPSTKRFVVTIITFCTFISPMTATIYFPVLNPIAHDLGVSISLINLTLTTYMIFQAIGPTLFGDLADVAGRRPAIIISLSIYLVANLGLALQNNYAALLVLRMLQSGGGAGTYALGFAVVADIAVSSERGKYMGIVGLGANVGPAISPALGGILAQYLGWRSIFWFSFIFAAVVLVPYILFIPETCRNVVGNGSIPARGWNMTLIDYIRFRRHPPADASKAKKKMQMPNPFNTLKVVLEKDMAMLLFYNTMLYLIFILIGATFSTILAPTYNLNTLQIGLCYLPYGVGCLLAAVVQGYLLDWNYRRIAHKIGFTINYRKGDDLRNFPIEKARIQIVVPILTVGVLATICFGWVLHFEANLAAPLVMVFIVGLCVTGSFSIINTLLIDLYPHAPATAVAANNFLRCLFGAGGTAVIDSVLHAMGRGWTFTFLAFVVTVTSPVLWIVIKWGPKWREERRVRLLKIKEEREAREAEHEQSDS